LAPQSSCEGSPEQFLIALDNACLRVHLRFDNAAGIEPHVNVWGVAEHRPHPLSTSGTARLDANMTDRLTVVDRHLIIIRSVPSVVKTLPRQNPTRCSVHHLTNIGLHQEAKHTPAMIAITTTSRFVTAAGPL
jgi:hypothetical protein